MAQLGEIIDGKYEILREIGRGGMSVVYLAMDKRLNKQWAIKEYRKDSQFQELAKKSLIDEANLMKKLDHPTLPRIVDIIDSGQTVYIVMDYIEGESLNKVLDAYGAQPQEAVIEWGKQLSEVLDYLHTRVPSVVYRDMKPANIMLRPDGTIRLFDFGIAKEVMDSANGDTTVGTRGYAAPEQFTTGAKIDARTDIYALGVTLYHLVTGKNPAEPPYEIYPIRHWNPSLSSGLEWLIQKSTQLNPIDRYQSCAEVTYVLENIDKFEGEYKKKQRSKINIFTTMIVMTLIFAIIGSASLFLKNKVETENYESYMVMNTVEGYENAISINPENPNAYLKLVAKFRELYQENGKKFSDQTSIITSFSNSRLSNLKTASVEDYVKINYELGRLYWDFYADESGSSTAAIQEAKKYFEAALLAASQIGKTGGLTEQQYNLSKAYYLIAYFNGNNKDMHNGIEITASEAAQTLGIKGIDSNNIIKSPFRSFWDTNNDLLEMIVKESSIPTPIKLDTVDKLSYLLFENYSDFKNLGEVTSNEMTTFFNKLVDATKSINVNSGSDDEKLQKRIISYLKTAKHFIEEEYKIKGKLK